MVIMLVSVVYGSQKRIWKIFQTIILFEDKKNK